MAVMDRDAQIMEEADKQRRHEMDLAKIDAETKRAQAVNAREVAKSRHELVGYFGVGIAIVAVIATIIGGILWGVMDGRKDQQQRERQRNEIATTCIREGNIWLNGNCIPAQK